MSNSSANPACAACKFQRRRCSQECPLAPYFPAEENQKFMNCKRLFGVSNMVRFLKEVDPMYRDDTMKSLKFEADMREVDPVHGCLGVINRLKEQIGKLTEELNSAQQQLRILMEQQQQSYGVFQPHHHHFQSAGAMAPQPGISSPPIPYGHPMDSGMEYEAKAIYTGRQEFPPRANFEHHKFSAEEMVLSQVHLVNHLPDQELKNAAALFTLTSQH